MPKMTDADLMKYACELASQNIINGGTPFGCVITDSERNVISTGQDRVVIDNDPTLHAEMVAIKNACKEKKTFNLSDCRLYTSCEPCSMCLSAIYWSRITIVFYGNMTSDASEIGFDNSFIYEEINKPIEKRSIQMNQMNSSHARNSFDKWEKYDKRTYY